MSDSQIWKILGLQLSLPPPPLLRLALKIQKWYLGALGLKIRTTDSHTNILTAFWTGMAITSTPFLPHSSVFLRFPSLDLQVRSYVEIQVYPTADRKSITHCGLE